VTCVDFLVIRSKRGVCEYDYTEGKKVGTTYFCNLSTGINWSMSFPAPSSSESESECNSGSGPALEVEEEEISDSRSDSLSLARWSSSSSEYRPKVDFPRGERNDGYQMGDTERERGTPKRIFFVQLLQFPSFTQAVRSRSRSKCPGYQAESSKKKTSNFREFEVKE
jgi:hypothetical protein